MLVEYFRFYAWHFDVRHDVISIRRSFASTIPSFTAQTTNTTMPPAVVQKIDKYEESAWFHGDVLSIEDPFEIGYDVAHVIRATQMSYIRKEFLVRFYYLYMIIKVTMYLIYAFMRAFVYVESIYVSLSSHCARFKCWWCCWWC